MNFNFMNKQNFWILNFHEQSSKYRQKSSRGVAIYVVLFSLM